MIYNIYMIAVSITTAYITYNIPYHSSYHSSFCVIPLKLYLLTACTIDTFNKITLKSAGILQSIT